MNRQDRLLGLILALQTGRKRSGELAARFEVSRRTILRDLNALGQVGIPIVALPGPNGGFEIAEAYFVRPLQFTSAEVSLLLLGLRALGPFDQSDFGAARQTVEEKLRAVIPVATWKQADQESDQIKVVPLGNSAHRPRHWVSLRNAITREDWLRVIYRGEHGDGERGLLPRSIFLDRGRWYLRAICSDARAERTYRVDRIVNIDKMMAPPNAAEILAAAANHACVRPANLETVVVEVAAELVRRLDDHPDFAGRVVDTPRGLELRFTTPASELAYFARELFAYGPLARVLAPDSLRDLVHDLAANTLALYTSATGAEISEDPVSPIP